MFKMTKRLLAVGAVAALALASIMPASAGTSGQQIRYWDYNALGYAEISGNNQYGNYGTWYQGYTPNIPGNNFSNLGGWWWQGWVTMESWTNGGAYYGVSSCSVPVYQPGNDWTNCYP